MANHLDCDRGTRGAQPKVKLCQKQCESLPLDGEPYNVRTVNGTPSSPECLDQTKQILGSRIFIKKPTPAKLLKRIVELHLEGRPIDERILGVEVFRRDEDWDPSLDTIVRENLRLLRKHLAEYYVTAGRDSRILLEIAAYTPIFTYTRASASFTQCRIGYGVLANGDPIRASMFFSAAIKQDSQYSDAYIGLANCHLLGCILYGHRANSELMNRAEKLARSALDLKPIAWEANAVLGAVYSFRRRWDDAAEQFERTLEIDPMQSKRNPWSLMHACATGLGRFTVRHAESQLLENPTDSASQVFYVLSLYLNLDPIQAHADLARFEFIEHFTSVALLCSACVQLAGGDGSAALGMLDQMDAGIKNCSLALGLRALAFGWADRRAEAQKIYARLQKGHNSLLALALAQMGVGKGPEAVVTLRRACKEFEPLMILMPMLPLLAPLLSLREYRTLVSQYRPFGKRH